MAWRIFVLASGERAALEEVLKDDVLWRQTQVLRDAGPLGGAAGEVYLYMEGSETAMARADELIPPKAKKVEAALGEKLHARFKEEEEMSAQGMGLMFSE